MFFLLKLTTEDIPGQVSSSSSWPWSWRCTHNDIICPVSSPLTGTQVTAGNSSVSHLMAAQRTEEEEWKY